MENKDEIRVQKRDGSYTTFNIGEVALQINQAMGSMSLNTKSVLEEVEQYARTTEILTTAKINARLVRACINMYIRAPTDPKQCHDMINWNRLATHVLLSDIQKVAPKTYQEALKIQFERGLLSKKFYKRAIRLQDFAQNTIEKYAHLFSPDHLALLRLRKSYLLRQSNNHAEMETPQQMYMRVALFSHAMMYRDNESEEKASIENHYRLMISKKLSFGSPVLFNAGTTLGQCASCFTGDTRVWCNGKLTAFSDIKEEEFDTYNGDGDVVRARVHKVRAHIKTKLIKFVLENSEKVTVTHDHRFMTREDWKTSEELGKGDEIKIVDPSNKHYTYVSIAEKDDDPYEVGTNTFFYTLNVNDESHSYLTEGGLVSKNCFLFMVSEDSMHGITDAFSILCMLCKSAGGVGKNFDIVRAKGSHIKGTNGNSCGAHVFLGMSNAALCVDQCFVPETPVLTEHGWKPIKDIRAGSHIYTHAGTLEQVLETKKYKEEKRRLLTLSGLSAEPVTCTEGHEFLRLQPTELSRMDAFRTQPMDQCIKDYNEGLAIPQFVAAKDLAQGDIVMLDNAIQADKLTRLVQFGIQRATRIEKIEASERVCPVYDLEINHPENKSYLVPLGVVHNGGNKRKGVCAIYMSPYNMSFPEILGAKKGVTDDHKRIKDLFYAVWMCKLLARRARKNGTWMLFDPKEVPDLLGAYGADFDRRYERYEKGYMDAYKAKHKKEMPVIPMSDYSKHAYAGGDFPCIRVSAVELMDQIVFSMIETGVPYILCRDTINELSNLKYYGPVDLSNLCAEIVQQVRFVQYGKPDEHEISVCNLCCINVGQFVYGETPDYEEIKETAYFAVKCMNGIIENANYPAMPGPSQNGNERENMVKKSNERHRHMGIGLAGVADGIIKMKQSYCSLEAQKFQYRVCEALQYGATEASIDEVARWGVHWSWPYTQTYRNKTFHHKRFKFNDAHVQFIKKETPQGKVYFNPWKQGRHELRSFFDWDRLHAKLDRVGGEANASKIALMPTATNSHLTQATPSFEGIRSVRQNVSTQVGDHIQYHPLFVKDMMERGLWNADFCRELNKHGGLLDEMNVPQDVKDIYQSMYQVPLAMQLWLNQLRQFWVDQAQSASLFLKHSQRHTLYQYVLLGLELDIKTVSYYTLIRPDVMPQVYNRPLESPAPVDARTEPTHADVEMIKSSKKRSQEPVGASSAKKSRMVKSSESIEHEKTSKEDPKKTSSSDPLGAKTPNATDEIVDFSFCDRSEPDCKACNV